MGDAGDPAERVVGAVARGIDFPDDRMLCPGRPAPAPPSRYGHRRGHDAALPGPASAADPGRRSSAVWVNNSTTSANLRSSTADAYRCTRSAERKPVGHGKAHGSGGKPLLSRMSSRHSRRVCPVCCMHTRTGDSSATGNGSSVGSAVTVTVGLGYLALGQRPDRGAGALQRGAVGGRPVGSWFRCCPRWAVGADDHDRRGDGRRGAAGVLDDRWR